MWKVVCAIHLDFRRTFGPASRDFSFGSCGGMVWNERMVYFLKLVKSSRRSIPAGRGLTGCPAEKAPGATVKTELNMSQVRIRQSGLPSKMHG